MLSFAGVTLDVDLQKVTYNNQSVILTSNEANILSLLLQSKGTYVRHEVIKLSVWKSDTYVDNNIVAVNMSRLRKKLSSIGLPHQFISTSRGNGYYIHKSS